MHLISTFCHFSCLDSHHSCIIDQEVDFLKFNLFHKFSYAFLISQIKIKIFNFGLTSFFFDLFYYLLSLFFIPRSNNDMASCFCQFSCCFFSNSRISSCDNCTAAFMRRFSARIGGASKIDFEKEKKEDKRGYDEDHEIITYINGKK